MVGLTYWSKPIGWFDWIMSYRNPLRLGSDPQHYPHGLGGHGPWPCRSLTNHTPPHKCKLGSTPLALSPCPSPPTPWKKEGTLLPNKPCFFPTHCPNPESTVPSAATTAQIFPFPESVFPKAGPQKKRRPNTITCHLLRHFFIADEGSLLTTIMLLVSRS